MSEGLTHIQGERVWKSIAEHNQRGLGHGEPYYDITKIKDVYHFWKLDTEQNAYLHVKSDERFRPLFEEGRQLDDELLEQRRIARGGDIDWIVFSKHKRDNL